MDISNLIVSSSINTDGGGILVAGINKIIDVVGYEVKSYGINPDISTNLFLNLFSFLFGSWVGILLLLFLLVVLGEILFYIKIKKDKVSFLETQDSFIFKHKFICYVISVFVIYLCIMIIPFLIIMLLYLILNLHILLIAFISAVIYSAILLIGISIVLKVIVKLNKAMFGHLIKRESEEEYEARQSTYKFRDGTIVKVKPNIIEDMEIDNNTACRVTARLSKRGTVFDIKEHTPKKRKARLREAKDNIAGRSIYECFLMEASKEEKDNFINDKLEYVLKMNKLNKKIIRRFINWLVTMK